MEFLRYNIMNKTTITSMDEDCYKKYIVRDKYGSIQKEHLDYIVSKELYAHILLYKYGIVKIELDENIDYEKLDYLSLDLIDYDKLYIDYKLLNKLGESDFSKVTPILNYSDIIKFKTFIKGFTFEEVMIKVDIKSSWTDILYDSKSISKRLHLVVPERFLFLNSEEKPFSKVSNLSIPWELFQDIDLIFEIQEEPIGSYYKEKEYDSKLDSYENDNIVVKYKINFDDNDMPIISEEGNEFIKKSSIFWSRILKKFRSYTPNIFFTSLDSSKTNIIPSRANLLDNYNPKKPKIIVSELDGKYYNLEKLVFLDSLERYGEV